MQDLKFLSNCFPTGQAHLYVLPGAVDGIDDDVDDDNDDDDGEVSTHKNWHPPLFLKHGLAV